MQAYSDDLRRRVLDRLQASLQTQAEIAVHFAVSLRFVEKLWHRFRTTGSYHAQPHGGGRTHLLAAHETLLRALVAEQPDRTLTELVALVAQHSGQPPVALDTLSAELQRLKLPRKKR